MSTIIRGNEYLLSIVWGLVVFVWLQLIWAALNWSTEYLVVTSGRLLLISGIFSRRISITPLTTISDLSFDRPFAGRLFGYGTFIIERAEKALSMLEYLPYPEQLYLEICGLIFPGIGGEEGEESVPG
jgi:hypothetical protein